MAKLYRIYVGIITALVLCELCQAEVNTTSSANGTGTHCNHHGNRDNCTDSAETETWSGHFSKCPEELKHYCIHGQCRYVKQQKAPSCICQHGYHGARCEYVVVAPLIGDKGVIIVCAIAGLMFFILFIVFLCCCARRRWRWCWQRKQRREAPSNGTEKLSMMDAGAALAATVPGSGETPHADAV